MAFWYFLKECAKIVMHNLILIFKETEYEFKEMFWICDILGTIDGIRKKEQFLKSRSIFHKINCMKKSTKTLKTEVFRNNVARHRLSFTLLNMHIC